MSNPKFAPGQIVLTGGIEALIESDAKFGMFVAESVMRHIRGNWGDDHDLQDIRVNDDALRNRGRLVSAYRYTGNITSIVTDDVTRVWIETDEHVDALTAQTTVMLPSES